jgi:hypothetical protein
MEKNAKKVDRSSEPDNKAAAPLVRLPKVEEFEELLSRDVPLETTSCEMNYSVYHRYNRTC